MCSLPTLRMVSEAEAMGVLDAIEQVLDEAGQPLHYRDITHRVLEHGLWQTQGLTPHDTISAELAVNIKARGTTSRFQRTSKGIFALRAWGLPEYIVPATLQGASNSRGEPEQTSTPTSALPLSTISLPLVIPVAPTASSANGHAPASESSHEPDRKREQEPPQPIPATLSFTEAAEYVLKHVANRRPLHYRDITQQALDQGLVRTSGRTPEATLYAQLLSENARRARRGEAPRFVKHGRGYVGLTAWQDVGLARQIEQHNADVRRRLHARLREMSPEDFEALIGQLLVAIGFENVEVTSRSGDGGIDVRGTLVVGDVIRTRMAVQVKRWRQNVQAPIVQQVRGALGAHEQGLIVTTSDFGRGARAEAQRPDATPVGVMNGEQLVALLVEHDIGIHRTTHDLIEIGTVEPE